MVGPSTSTPGPSLPAFGRASLDAARRATDLAAALSPFGWPRPAGRQRYQADRARLAGAAGAAAYHDRWASFFGDARPLSAAALDGGLDRLRTRRLRALDAAVDVEVEVDRALQVLRRPQHSSPADVLAAVVVAAIAAPTAVVADGTSRAAAHLARTAPPLPPVRMPKPDRASLLTSTLATVVPEILSHSVLRHVLLRLPSELTIGVRSGRSASSVTIGRKGIRVTNGLARSASIVVDGDVRSVLRRASGNLIEELDELQAFDDGHR